MSSFSSDDKAVIKNDFEEKGWSAYRICQEHPGKNWVFRSVQCLIKKYKETGTMERRTGSGRPVTVPPKKMAIWSKNSSAHKKSLERIKAPRRSGL